MKTPYYNVPNLQKIADLEAEIERLRALVMPKLAEAGQWQELHEEIAQLKAEIARLKSDHHP